MNNALQEKLIAIARRMVKDDDPSHDFGHALRVLANARYIAKKEKADLDIIVPAALFHDVVNYPKNSPDANLAPEHSAEVAEKVLFKMKKYPKEKIGAVYYAIESCSFSKGVNPVTLEAKVLQDADALESVGAISIMRTFSSTGQMKRPFFHQDDPFCERREACNRDYALDLFYTRLLKILERIHTKTARTIARRRTKYLHNFLKELKLELDGK